MHVQTMASLQRLMRITGKEVGRSSCSPPTNKIFYAKVVSIDDECTCDLVIIRRGTFERFRCRLLGIPMPEWQLQDSTERALKCRDFLVWWCLGQPTGHFFVAAPPMNESAIQSMLDNRREVVDAEFTELDSTGLPLVRANFDTSCTPPQTIANLKLVKERDVARSTASPPTNIKVNAKVVSIQDSSTCDLVIIRDGAFQRFQCRLLGVDKPQLQDRSLTALKCRDFFAWLCCRRLMRDFRTFLKPLNEDHLQETLDNNQKLMHTSFSVLDNTGRPLVTLKSFPSEHRSFNAKLIDFDYEANLIHEQKFITGKDIARSAASRLTNVNGKAKVVFIHDASTCDLAILQNDAYQRIQCRLFDVDKSNLTDGSLNALKARDFFAWLCCHNNPRTFPIAAPPLNEDQLQGMLDHNEELVYAECIDYDKSDQPLVTLKSLPILTTTFNFRLKEFSHEKSMNDHLKHIKGDVVPRSIVSPLTDTNVCAKVVGVHDPFTCDLVIVRNGILERFLCRLRGLDKPRINAFAGGCSTCFEISGFFAWWCSGVSHPSFFPSFDLPWDERKRQDVLDDNENLVYAEFSGVGAFGEPLIILRRNPEDSATKTLNAVLVEYGYT